MSNQQKVTALTFDASTVDPQKPIEILPAGWYPVEISDAEVKATRGKSGGTRANFEFTVTAGDYKGRKIFGGINVKNANAQAQEIGQRELSAICHAVGVINVTDLAVFIGKQLQVKIKVKKATDADKEAGYEDRNEPSGYKALEGAAASAPAFAAPPAPGAPPFAAPPVAPPAPAATFPPAGWLPHPSAPGHFYSGQDVKTEAELRAMFPAPAAPPAAPVAPVAPPQPPMPPQPPVAPTPPAPVATFPPAGWEAHPQAPGWFFETANPTNMKAEADLRASVPAAPAAAPAGPPMPPAPAAGSPPPWKTPTA